ncbi:hypothetical protein [Vibrio alginolyticus]|nr:hypothetical protein [Vibrio alginolyticus]
MVWVGWLNDKQGWGRWRYEDEVNLKHNDASNQMALPWLILGRK